MTGIETEILIVGGAFFGAVLGRFFKVLVLMPAGAVAIALLLVRREVAGHTLLDSFVGIGLLIASLEVGYVMGLISTDISAAAQGFRGFLARSRRRDRRARPSKVNQLCLVRCFAPGTFVERLSRAARDARARSNSMEWDRAQSPFSMIYNAKPGGHFRRSCLRNTSGSQGKVSFLDFSCE